MGNNWLTVPSVLTFLLVLCRISGLFLTAPIFNNQSVPARSKIGIAVGLTVILYSVLTPEKGFVPPHDAVQFAWMAIQEIIVGALLGFAVTVVLAGVQMCGEIVSTQQGLTVSNILDPLTQAQVPVIGQFYYFMALLLFLGLNMHHVLILALNRSFEWIPLGHSLISPTTASAGIMGPLVERFIVMTSNTYVIALMLGIPVFGVLLVMEVALALTTKVMPQMNIFVVGLPFKVALGTVMIMISLPSSAEYLTDQYQLLTQELMSLFRM